MPHCHESATPSPRWKMYHLKPRGKYSNRHSKVDRGKTKRPQPYTKNSRPLRNAERGEMVLPREEHTSWSSNPKQSALNARMSSAIQTECCENLPAIRTLRDEMSPVVRSQDSSWQASVPSLVCISILYSKHHKVDSFHRRTHGCQQAVKETTHCFSYFSRSLCSTQQVKSRVEKGSTSSTLVLL